MSNSYSLAELQLRLQDFLLHEKTVPQELTVETPNFSRATRLAIYHQAYRLRLIDTLQNDFPAIAAYLGKDAFDELANDYISAHPSQHASLRWFGKEFANSIAQVYSGEDKQILFDLAQFEWAQVMAFDAADIALVQLQDLRELAADSWMLLRLEFHPAVIHLQLATDAPSLWQSLIKNDGAAASKTIETTEPQDWIVWRDNLQVVYRSLTAMESACLTAFYTNKNFSEVCELLCDWLSEDKVPLQAATFLQQWINSGIITKIITE